MAQNSKTILVVDDVPVNVHLLTTYLSSEGYTIVSAKDGEEAIEQVRKYHPDLVLLDVMMPKLNGFEVCKVIKNDKETNFIPVIMVTALNELEDKVKGMDAGADDFISKPFNKLELLVRVRSLLRIKYLNDTLNEKLIELQKAKEELRQLAITDGLTGLYNYRYFKDQLLQELNRARRHNLNVSVFMIDIDHFKQYNDRNGHPAGDTVLKTIARLLKDNVRNIDIAARYGGEEFALVLIETGKSAAKIVAEKIRKLVENHSFAHEAFQPNGKITISVGVATFPEDGQDFDKIVNMADQRLYRAKQSGRNTICAESNSKEGSS
ncbi:diguanylate cyclase [candidate division KSB1 bacterium]|nr:diguanylate cyclase [candidate division KSB1 bacterium]NIR70919.1 diguanylate cyclase [candidate division KSB1 bacterium]NIS23091.1 diguanylate cyclase [candidate division KSB1 bacterium]NIT69926.1 diguanylate cyclase [candidate division KSB1 bacterium]NIU23592.1 diguanylate cyclase [candidate division KSB1 bacterium]